MLHIIKQAANVTTASVTSVTRAALKKAHASVKGRAARSTGYAAEAAAAKWLQAQGLKIVERNVRYKFGEIDIVAWEHAGTAPAVLVLFEVRLRKNARFGDAATSITPSKQRRLWAAGEAYAARFKHPPPMRIDVLAYDALPDGGEPDATGQAVPRWIKNALA